MTDFVETTILTCRPGSVPGVVAHLDGLLAGQPGFIGCWTTEIGALDRVVVCFVYPAETAPVRVDWPDHRQGVAKIERSLWQVHGGTVPQPGAHGGIYEWRVYDILPGCEARVVGLMEEALPARSVVSPAYVVMTSCDGASRLCHVWPYETLAARAGKRREALESGVWPPPGILNYIGAMHSTLLVPTAFSPSR